MQGSYHTLEVEIDRFLNNYFNLCLIRCQTFFPSHAKEKDNLKMLILTQSVLLNDCMIYVVHFKRKLSNFTEYPDNDRFIGNLKMMYIV